MDPVDCRHATCETSAVLLAMLSKLPRLTQVWWGQVRREGGQEIATAWRSPLAVISEGPAKRASPAANAGCQLRGKLRVATRRCRKEAQRAATRHAASLPGPKHGALG